MTKNTELTIMQPLDRAHSTVPNYVSQIALPDRNKDLPGKKGKHLTSI